MFCFFGGEACGILAPRPGIKPASPALEGKVREVPSFPLKYLSYSLSWENLPVHPWIYALTPKDGWLVKDFLASRESILENLL